MGEAWPLVWFGYTIRITMSLLGECMRGRLKTESTYIKEKTSKIDQQMIMMNLPGECMRERLRIIVLVKNHH